MRQVDVSAHIPRVRPHNRVRDRKLFFMISNRPILEWSAEEALLYESIDGRKTVAELEKMHTGAHNRLLRWQAAAIIELIPPVAAPASPHLVVIEPHMDDAVLSAGGRLLHRRGQCRVTILSVVKWSNFTSYLLLKRDFLNVRDITDLRQQESTLAASLLGADHRCLDWTDAPLRFWPAERWSLATVETFAAAPDTFVNQFPDPGDVSQLAERLGDILSALAPTELWIPMGLGDHVDHRTTRSACLRMLAGARERFAHVPVVMYEDVPYASHTATQAAQISAALASNGMRLVRCTEDITDVLEEKLRVASVYASQFKLSYIGPKIRQLAEREGGSTGTFAEAYHRLEGEPCLPCEALLSRDWFGLARLRTEICQLLAKRIECRRLTVMALPSGHLGRWKNDRESLLAAFPNAEIRVYVSEEWVWLAEEGGSDKLSLRIVRGGKMSWIGACWIELFRFGTPTVVLWCGAYGSGFRGALIKWLLPFRRVMLAKTLCEFCRILSDQPGASNPD